MNGDGKTLVPPLQEKGIRGTKPSSAYTAQHPTCFGQVAADLAPVVQNSRAQQPTKNATLYNEQKSQSSTFTAFSSLSPEDAKPSPRPPSSLPLNSSAFQIALLICHSRRLVRLLS